MMLFYKKDSTVCHHPTVYIAAQSPLSSLCPVFQLEWLSLSPTDTEPKPFADQGSLSSHRQHGDGTYSQSSHLAVPPNVSPGTKIICRVSHPALDTPLDVSVLVESPEPGMIVYLFLIMLGDTEITKKKTP